MEPLIAGTVTGVSFGGVSTLVAAWMHQRGKCQRLREEVRRDHVRHLPAGSHVIDLGGRGILIEVGKRGGIEGSPDATP